MHLEVEMIPSYPYSILIEYRPHINRKPVVRNAPSLDGIMAIYEENIGRQDVYRCTVSVILHQALARRLRAKEY